MLEAEPLEDGTYRYLLTVERPRLWKIRLDFNLQEVESDEVRSFLSQISELGGQWELTGGLLAIQGLLAEGEEDAPAEDPANSTVFTLEVTPDQAERIVYAFENGSIWLTLVPTDFVEVETDGVVIDNLFGGDLIEEIFGNLETTTP